MMVAFDLIGNNIWPPLIKTLLIDCPRVCVDTLNNVKGLIARVEGGGGYFAAQSPAT